MALGGELSQPLGFPPDEIFIFRFAGFYGHISPLTSFEDTAGRPLRAVRRATVRDSGDDLVSKGDSFRGRQTETLASEQSGNCPPGDGSMLVRDPA
jgi:hypothetical protein